MLNNRFKLTIVAALSDNHVIGCNNQLPWSLPADMKRVRELTLHKPLLMGRKTHESIGRPLPERHNIILTRNPTYQSKGCSVIQDITQLDTLIPNEPEVILFGGEQLYQLFLPLVDCMHLTLVHTTLEGDAFFPEWDTEEWEETERTVHQPDEKNTFAYDFVTLLRDNRAL